MFSAKSIASGATSGSAFGPVGSLIGGLAGPIIGGLFGRSGQDSANRTNLQIARENRAWQEMMSNTANQRAARDLEKAGLNRILALGRPASTPAGNIATMQNKNKMLAEGITAGVQTALQARRLNQEIKESNARIRLQDAQTATQRAQVPLLSQQTLTESVRRAGITTANAIAKLDLEIKKLGMQEVHSKETFFRWLRSAPLQERDYWMQRIYGNSAFGMIQKWLNQIFGTEPTSGSKLSRPIEDYRLQDLKR